MYRSVLLALTLALSATSAFGAKDKACPNKTSPELVAVKVHHKTEYVCECLNDKGKSKSFKKGCYGIVEQKKHGIQCVSYCDAKPPKPSASKRAEPDVKKRSLLGDRQFKLTRRSKVDQLNFLPNGEIDYCDAPAQLCPVTARGLNGLPTPTTGEYACTYVKEDIDNCGECGNSCNAIEGAKNAACFRGTCQISSCSTGFALRTDSDGSTYCRPVSL